MFGIKNITAVEIDQLPYQKLPWYGHYWYGKIDQMVISKDDNKEDNIMMMVMIWLKKKRSVICGWVGARVRLRKHNVWRHPLFPSPPSCLFFLLPFTFLPWLWFMYGMRLLAWWLANKPFLTLKQTQVLFFSSIFSVCLCWFHTCLPFVFFWLFDYCSFTLYYFFRTLS